MHRRSSSQQGQAKRMSSRWPTFGHSKWNCIKRAGKSLLLDIPVALALVGIWLAWWTLTPSASWALDIYVGIFLIFSPILFGFWWDLRNIVYNRRIRQALESRRYPAFDRWEYEWLAKRLGFRVFLYGLPAHQMCPVDLKKDFERPRRLLRYLEETNGDI